MVGDGSYGSLPGPTSVLARDRFSPKNSVRDATSDVRVRRAMRPYQITIVVVDFAREVSFCERESDTWFPSELPMA